MKSIFKRISKSFSIAALLLAVLSCSAKTEEKNATYIDIDGALGKGRIIPLSEIAEDVTLIPLETADSLMVGDLFGARNFISYENGHIYLLDKSRTIWIFDKKGKFVRKFNRNGRGPEEFPDVSGFEVEPETGNIDVFASTGKFYEYSKYGPFIRRVDFPETDNISIGLIASGYKLNSNLYICSTNPDQDNKESDDKSSAVCAIAFDSLSTLTGKVYFPESRSGTASVVREVVSRGKIDEHTFITSVPINAKLLRFKDKIRIMYQFDNIITTVNEKFGQDTAYTINWGKYGTTKENYSATWDFSSEVISLIQLMESDNYLYFWLNLRGLAHDPLEVPGLDLDGKPTIRKNTNSYAIFNKKSGEFTLMDRPGGGDIMGFLDDISGGPLFWPKYISSEDYLVSFCTALDLIEYAENKDASEKVKKIAAKLDENDNPVIVLVKLKKQ
ncbi:MAG: 6-bladed beta-propeller [Bacteroidales bacterium]|nr:6-bladed beta-propeller [Bacteroidales bacterium]MDD2424808.1 6-bladed beta-propeller [Bacteroidales bacterium]MDD3989953.1 6-bladed beta-propeller [Bacteroidales bacterium]MDD4638650.1 6-bladed beta-propeller [Bacteroidales bacterium]